MGFAWDFLMIDSNMHMPHNTDSTGQCVNSIVINGLMVQVKVVTLFIFVFTFLVTFLHFRIPL